MASYLMCLPPTDCHVFKCKGSFYLPCVSDSVNEWLDSCKRKSTWKCVNCFEPSAVMPPKTCDCKISKCEIVCAQKEDLDQAKSRIKELEKEVKKIEASFDSPVSSNNSTKGNQMAKS